MTPANPSIRSKLCLGFGAPSRLSPKGLYTTGPNYTRRQHPVSSNTLGATRHKEHRSHSKSMHSNATKSAEVSTDSKKIGVLFVCLGNICRSPTAEAMFKAVVEKSGLSDNFVIDSCGTGGGNPDWYIEGGWSYHEGNDSDPRMKVAAKNRGVVITSKSRPLTPNDVTGFDYIIGMDNSNMTTIRTAIDHWISNQLLTEGYRSKFSLMTSYLQRSNGISEVPDPYFGGPQGFETVLDLLEDACSGLLTAIKSDNPAVFS